MAELATIARPYAEALFKADGVADQAALADLYSASAYGRAMVASSAMVRVQS